MKLLLVPLLLLAGCATYPPAPALPSAGPSTDTTPPPPGTPVAIVSVEFLSSMVRLRVPSTRCTQTGDFLPRIRRSDMGGNAVQLILTRRRPDACPDRPAGTKLLEYRLDGIGIQPGDAVRVLNSFEPAAAS